MINVHNVWSWQLFGIPLLSGIAAFFTDTKGFIFALIIALAFNVWAGMRADGVSIIRCKNFKINKFTQAILQFILYLVVIESIYSILRVMGDQKLALYLAKSMTYIFLYVYVNNGFKNLCIAYPKNMALKMIYFFVRCEFWKATPAYAQKIIERVNKEYDEPKTT